MPSPPLRDNGAYGVNGITQSRGVTEIRSFSAALRLCVIPFPRYPPLPDQQMRSPPLRDNGAYGVNGITQSRGVTEIRSFSAALRLCVIPFPPYPPLSILAAAR